MNLFWGRHDKRIDKKGRVSVPSDFRAALAEANASSVVVLPEPREPFLRAMAPAEFQDILRQLKQTYGRFDAKRTRASRQLFSRAQEMQFDSEGRIILPKKFLDYADIVDTLSFVGAGDHFQIWNSASLDAEENDDDAMADDVLAALEGLPAEGALS
ncbi:MraZ protein [Rhodothalassium salexigens DSM 2132]|uniref:Transcriptional regulator MraZ n=2 Tax=Rhodothalassium salexigens TaxID=1086 RepID=A0A4R2PC00_RHOSA|nr:division/cell wall cluster transcriptional repressor MraZ [Rhodothalassium salexigens]MBB4212247.1 MraZ protein [Rhodothalassium salexigens DSM 2132]TCP32602.1 MraZ protein [Rhodothalassium salexigens DSM 2132]